MNKSNPHVIWFRFAHVLRYIFQTFEKNPLLALFHDKVKSGIVLPRTTMLKIFYGKIFSSQTRQNYLFKIWSFIIYKVGNKWLNFEGCTQKIESTEYFSEKHLLFLRAWFFKNTPCITEHDEFLEYRNSLYVPF